MEIEERIKKESESYSIQTSSADILSMYREKKKKRFPLWIPVTGLLGAVACLIAILVPLNLPKPDTPQSAVSVTPIVEKNVPLEDDSLLSQAGLQLFFSSQLESAKISGNVKSRQFSLIGDLIEEETEKKQERIKKNYASLFSLQQSFFETDNQISYTYGKTQYYYKNEKYNYVLMEGENKIYTQNDIDKDFSLDKAVYVLKGNIYQGTILVNKDEESYSLITRFENDSESITVLKGEDEDGSGLFYQVRDKSDKADTPSEFYKISTEFSLDEAFQVNIIHSTTKVLLKADTIKDGNDYHVDYFDMQYMPFSLVKEEFDFTLDDMGNILYQFQK